MRPFTPPSQVPTRTATPPSRAGQMVKQICRQLPQQPRRHPLIRTVTPPTVEVAIVSDSDTALSGTTRRASRRHVYVPILGGSPTKSCLSTVLPLSTEPKGTRSPQRRPHQRKARGGAQTRQVRRHPAATTSILSPFALETTGGHGASTVYRVGVPTLDQANARLGSAGGHARGQASRRSSRLRFAGARSPE